MGRAAPGEAGERGTGSDAAADAEEAAGTQVGDVEGEEVSGGGDCEGRERLRDDGHGSQAGADPGQAYDRRKAVDAVEIPDEAVKLRLIGREGRNARAFQRATGVDLVIDDTPGVVLISSFHPLRRALARRCLERLVEGGPIHPGRITELAGECRDELDAVLLENGTAAAEKAGVEDLHEDLRVLLGRLDHCRIRGQSALRHGLETAALAGSMAAELSLDAALARRAGLLLPAVHGGERGRVEHKHLCLSTHGEVCAVLAPRKAHRYFPLWEAVGKGKDGCHAIKHTVHAQLASFVHASHQALARRHGKVNHIPGS